MSFSLWCAIEGHSILLVATPPGLSLYFQYSLSGHTREQIFYCTAISVFSVFAFMAFMYFDCDGPVSSEGDCGSPWVWDSGMLVLLLSGVCETLDKMGAVTVQPDYGFDMSLGYMLYCSSCDVNGLRCTSLQIPYNFKMGELSDVPQRSTSPTCCHNINGSPINDVIVPASPVYFVPGDLTPLQTIKARVCPWLFSHHPPEVLDSEGPSEAPEDGDFETGAANVEG